jgi:hypothetical protein
MCSLRQLRVGKTPLEGGIPKGCLCGWGEEETCLLGLAVRVGGGWWSVAAREDLLSLIIIITNN